MALSIATLMLSFAADPIMLSVVMLNVVMLIAMAHFLIPKRQNI
jgi:hypothetical protein